jgi:hypothetical protein
VTHPILTTDDGRQTTSVTLAVFAPFGTDETLSNFPNGASQDLAQHPLFENLLKVAEQDVHVLALIDRAGDDTLLVRIPAGQPDAVRVESRWKQDMSSPNTLAGLLHEAWLWQPDAAIVLAMEGHGAGYLPEIDRRKLSMLNITDNGKVVWRIGVTDESPALPIGAPILPIGAPILPIGAPILPIGAPILPMNHMPISTYGLGKALRDAQAAGVPKLAAIHFNNCFNMSAELLHTIAPYADYAVGYPNYNFFTAGAAYPQVFAKLQSAGSAASQQLALWFAESNHAVLAAKGNHPTAGCAMHLAAMHDVTEKLDDLADALLSALRTAPNAGNVRNEIKQAIIRAQQYDTEAGFALETPDELTDLCSFAHALIAANVPANYNISVLAQALVDALLNVKVYGDDDRPWIDPSVRWNFSAPALAMNIFLPDPLLRGLWDWRSPYYLDVNPDPAKPAVQPGIIDFLQVTDWVDFLIEYHKDTPFFGLLPAAIPAFPAFNAGFEPPPDQPPTSDDPHDSPDQSSPSA